MKSKQRAFASKVVGRAVDAAASDLIAGKKNPKTIKKWNDKMKLSIQKKVYNASKKLFQLKGKDGMTQGSITNLYIISYFYSLIYTDELEKEIKAIKTKINQQLKNIKDKTENLINKSTLAKKIPAVTTTTDNEYHVGSFGPQVNSICDSYKEIASSVDDVSKIITGRIDALKGTYTTAERDWKASDKGAKDKQKVKSNAPKVTKKDDNAMSKLNKHLATS